MKMKVFIKVDIFSILKFIVYGYRKIVLILKIIKIRVNI